MNQLPPAPRREKMFAVLNRSVARVRGEGGRWDALPQNLVALEWSKAELEEMQIRRLRELLSYAQNHVPYYRDLFASCGFAPGRVTHVDDLSVLPVLTKELIEENFERLISDEYDPVTLVRRKTGGSSGRTLQFLVAEDELERQMAMCQRTLVMAGVRPAGSQAKFWGYSSDQTWGNRISAVTGRLYFASSAATVRQYERWARYMQRVRPVMAYGYAGFMADFADYLVASGIEITGMKAAFSTAEMLHPHQREAIARGLNTQVFDAYGCREVPRVASECVHGSMHVMSDEVVLEIDDRDSETNVGAILLTPLFNRAMPLIRYDVGDEGCRAETSCTCGLPFPTMGMTLGKEYLRIELPGGDSLHCSALTSRVHQVEAIQRFQIQQLGGDRLRVIYETEANQAGDVRDQLADILSDIDVGLLKGRMPITAERVEEIETTPAGKRPMFRKLS